ncbi:MAG: hypothetical protein AAFQ43_15700 [Bacteroidota bacterium]
MSRRVLSLLSVVVVCAATLASGTQALLITLPGGIPFGTLLAEVAFVAGAAIPLAVSRPTTSLRWAGVVALIGAVIWFPLGATLAGNPRLSFVNDAADSAFFWSYTRGLGAFILVAMAWAGVSALLSRRRARSPEASDHRPGQAPASGA